MTARTRTVVLVVAAAAAAVSLVVGSEVLRSSIDPDATTERAKPRQGTPPLVFDLGLRTDREAEDLRAAKRLYDRGRRPEAARIFERYDSVEARVGAAFAAWPDETVETLSALARERPSDDLVRLHHGLALFWAGEDDAAMREWRAAIAPQVDSPSALRAEDLAYPNFPRGRPTFVPSFATPRRVARARPAEQLALLQRAADPPNATRPKLLLGLAYQRLGRPDLARAEFDAAVATDPRAAEPQVAAAVGRFEKAHPERAFARLGPLSRRFPRSQSVRFHLGLLLLWIGDVAEARDHLTRARALDAKSRLGREAERFLVRLANVRSE